MAWKRLLLALVIVPALVGLGCDDDDGNGNGADAGYQDGGTDGGTDGGVDGGGAGGLALQRAFTGDGLTVTAEFSAPLDAATATAEAFSLEADGAASEVAVSSVSVDGATATLQLASELPRGPVYALVVDGVTADDGDGLDPEADRAELTGTLHLALVWHQHQPVYTDPVRDYQRGPWVRKHATKDYYDMVAMLEEFPDIHLQVNLTPVLLMQLLDYYVARLEPCIDDTADPMTLDASCYLAQKDDGSPVTDPWMDMLVEPTPDPASLTDEERGWWWADIWSNFSISEVMLPRFPAYEALIDKRDTGDFTQDDLLNLKCWFQLAWFDPDFLRGPVELPNGDVVDLSGYVTEQTDGTFTLDQPFTEESCRQLVVEEYKVLRNVIPAHAALRYDAETKTGQVEMMTTPFYHPILPLLHDTELAKEAMPNTPMPSARFQHPEDAQWHVSRAAAVYEAQFGGSVTGMWPAEGSVAEAVIPHFLAEGVRWIATDRRVLEKSTPRDQPIYSPYRVDADDVAGSDDPEALAVVFRDTEISDKIGFHYQGNAPAENVADLVASLRGHAPAYGQDALLTIILDGENAWEWYRLDNDAKGFLRGMYQALTEAQDRREFVTVTVSEYLDGNEARGVAPHPVAELPELEPLFAGSWISGSFSTWIGEDEENLAWDYLARVRSDLETWGIPRPSPEAEAPLEGSADWYAHQTWLTMFAAEGSDWFWWYGSDQTAVGGDDPFDQIYRELLKNVYANANAYRGLTGGDPIEVPDFAPILRVCNPPSGELPAGQLPLIDGVFDPDEPGDAQLTGEWTSAGAGVCQDLDSSVVGDPEDVIQVWYHGVSSDALYVALRLSGDLTGTDAQVRVYLSQKHVVSVDPVQVEQEPFLATTRAGEPITFSAGGAAYEVVADLSGGGAVARIATAGETQWNPPADTDLVEAAASGDVVELRIPFEAIGYQADDPLELLATVTVDGAEVDRAPNLNSAVVFPDRTQLVELTFILDATGSEIALDAVSGIDDPPPPNGTGTAFIVGSLEALGNWTPNTVPMADDGETHGDETAGDNLWTFTLLVPPLSEVNYKYTIGSQGQSWGGTEEFPLTNRGFEVRDTDGDRRMIVRDIFADRPDPSGTLGPNTEILNP